MDKGIIVKKSLIFIALTVQFVAFFNPINSVSAQTPTIPSCKKVSGDWFIVDQYVTNPSSASPYYSEDQCHQAALAIYGCIPSIKGQQFMVDVTGPWQYGDIDFISDAITDDYRSSCINSTDRDDAVCGTNKRYFTCSCRKSNSSIATTLGLSRIWTTEDGTKYRCELEEFLLKDLKTLGITQIINPMAIINQVGKLLVAVALFLFIINILQGALLYVRSGGEEAELKKGRHKITASVAGLIFMFFITGVIMYIYEITNL